MAKFAVRDTASGQFRVEFDATHYLEINVAANGGTTLTPVGGGTLTLTNYAPDWGIVANKPATATRWPTWGEVTGKPFSALADAITWTGANVFTEPVRVGGPGASTYGGIAPRLAVAGPSHAVIAADAGAAFNPILALARAGVGDWFLRSSGTDGTGRFDLMPATGSVAVLSATQGGNLGIAGATIPDWNTGYRTINFKNASIAGGTGTIDYLGLLSNVYFDGAYKYRQLGPAVEAYVNQGQFLVRVAPEGAANTTVTLATALAVHNSGQLTVGVGSEWTAYPSRMVVFNVETARLAIISDNYTAGQYSAEVYMNGRGYISYNTYGAGIRAYNWGGDVRNVALELFASSTAIGASVSMVVVYSGYMSPKTDGGTALGATTLRWGQIYSTVASISTSARKYKDLQRLVSPEEGLQALRGLPIYQYQRKDTACEVRRFGPVLDEIPQWLQSHDDGENWLSENLWAANILATQALDSRQGRLESALRSILEQNDHLAGREHALAALAA